MNGGTETAIRHHPSEATLVAYGAGTLWTAAKPVVSAHLARCPHCRNQIELTEAVGGLLLEALPPSPLNMDALRQALERLDDEPERTAPRGRASAASLQLQPEADAAEPLGTTLRDLGLPVCRLRWLAPGLRHAVLLRCEPGTAGGTLRMLQVRPGAAIPRHAHHGTELTMVIEGAFTDETGRYGAGDLAEVEAEVNHRPVAEGPMDCICLVAEQGGPRFDGFLGRLFGAAFRD